MKTEGVETMIEKSDCAVQKSGQVEREIIALNGHVNDTDDLVRALEEKLCGVLMDETPQPDGPPGTEEILVEVAGKIKSCRYQLHSSNSRIQSILDRLEL